MCKKTLWVLSILAILNFTFISVFRLDVNIYEDIINNIDSIEFDYVNKEEYQDKASDILDQFYDSHTLFGMYIAKFESKKLMNKSIQIKEKYKKEHPIKYAIKETSLQAKYGLKENINSTIGMFSLSGVKQGISSLRSLIFHPIETIKDTVKGAYDTVKNEGVIYFITANISLISMVSVSHKAKLNLKSENKFSSANLENNKVNSKSNEIKSNPKKGLLAKKNRYLIKGRSLLPNNHYVTKHHYKYTTDSLGRISTVNVKKLKLFDGDRNNNEQRKLNKKKSDDAGHLIARQFGGSGNRDNLVAMDRKVNRVEFKKLENTWRAALIDKKKVSVSIKLKYFLTDRPISFNVKYCIDNVCKSEIIYNYPILNKHLFDDIQTVYGYKLLYR